MRTTLNLNHDLLAQAKAHAAREQLSLTRLIEEGLALPVHHGQGGLTAAVADARSNRQLLDAADGLSQP